MQDTQTQPQNQASPQRLALAYVEDSHNLGCFVRLHGETTPRRAHFSKVIQDAGVVIRAGHVVAVDTNSDPPEVVWRLGMRAGVLDVESDQMTLDLGYPNHRHLTLPLCDERPDDERAEPLAAGDTVLLRGKPADTFRIADVFAGDGVAHPERLRAHLARLSEEAGGTLGQSCTL